VTERAVRWRLTLDQLCHAARVTPMQLDDWAALGAFGPRWRERRERGRWRHIDRDTADRAVLMSRLTRTGISDELACRIVLQHSHGPTHELVHEENDVLIRVSREGLP